jgi:hypothetical protein
MSQSRKNKNQGPFPWRVHPIWRGIGLLLMVIIPFISLGITDMLLPLLDQPLPDYLAQAVTIPGIGDVETFYARAVLTSILSIALFFIISILFSIVYSLSGGYRDEDMAKFTKKYPRR